MHVTVIGGGSAGVAASVGAATRGASVTLLERQGFLGGMATGANVGTLCGLFLRAEVRRWAVHGFPRELAERLMRLDNQEPVSWRNGLHFLPYNAFHLRILFDQVLAGAGVDVRLHAAVHDVTAKPSGLQVGLLHWDRLQTLQTDAVIDTSGTAIAAHLLGASTIDDQTHQAPALVFGLTGLPDVPAVGLKLALLRAVRRGVESGQLPESAQGLSLVPGSSGDGQAKLKLGLGQPLPDDPAALSALEARLRREAHDIVGALVKLETVFSRARLYCCSAHLGVRTGRRVSGRTQLTGDDVLLARNFTDGVGLAPWPVELWSHGYRPELRLPPDGQAAEIPASCLESATESRLFAAGRCMSADATAIAATRVIGTCLTTGYAAGALAADGLRGTPRAETIRFLRQDLIPPDTIRP